MKHRRMFLSPLFYLSCVRLVFCVLCGCFAVRALCKYCCGVVVYCFDSLALWLIPRLCSIDLLYVFLLFDGSVCVSCLVLIFSCVLFVSLLSVLIGCWCEGSLVLIVFSIPAFEFTYLRSVVVNLKLPCLFGAELSFGHLVG